MSGSNVSRSIEACPSVEAGFVQGNPSGLPFNCALPSNERLGPLSTGSLLARRAFPRVQLLWDDVAFVQATVALRRNSLTSNSRPPDSMAKNRADGVPRASFSSVCSARAYGASENACTWGTSPHLELPLWGLRRSRQSGRLCLDHADLNSMSQSTGTSEAVRNLCFDGLHARPGCRMLSRPWPLPWLSCSSARTRKGSVR
jgi:hypothetical protein